MQSPPIRLGTVVSAPFQENTYIDHLSGRDDCLIIDPGLEPEQIAAYLQAHGLRPAAILVTHGHSDHIAGNGYLKARFPNCPIVASHGDAPKLTDPDLNLSGEFGVPLVTPPADVLVGEGDVYRAAGFELLVRETPGHSSGHVVFVWREGQPIVVFAGDVLFAGSIGRTDFSDGNFDQLADAIHTKLFTLPDDTQILPGHGPTTTVGQEKRTNPFVGAPAGYRG